MTAARHVDTPGPRSTDAELAIAAAAGDRVAFAVIYDRYADRLHDFCIGMLRDRDAAADCVQDAFCTAATKLADLREPDKLRPWLYSVARSEALRRIRARRREQLSGEVPDMPTTDAGPEALAARGELAELIAAAAGGLSDRDRSVLQLVYYHGLDGPELAEALEVSASTANKLVQRLRDTVERSLGALLVCRATQHDVDRCPELAGILVGWDGRFTVLTRKRVARHVEGCEVCDDERRRRVNPVALLGSAPVFIPAPEWLRTQTLERVQMPLAATELDSVDGTRRRAVLAALVAAAVLVGIGAVVLLQQRESTPVVPLDVTEPLSSTSPSRPPAEFVPPPGPPPTTTPPTTRKPNATTPAAVPAPAPPTRSLAPESTAPPSAIPRTTEPSTTIRTTSTRSTTRIATSVESEESSVDETTAQPATTTRRLPTAPSTRTVVPGTITTLAPIG